MSGLLAARSLTEAYERVTVVDRDALPAGFEGRRAVPQGREEAIVGAARTRRVQARLPVAGNGDG